MKLIDQKSIRKLKLIQNDEFIVEEQLQEKCLSENVTTALKEWAKYLEKGNLN